MSIMQVLKYIFKKFSLKGFVHSFMKSPYCSCVRHNKEFKLYPETHLYKHTLLDIQNSKKTELLPEQNGPLSWERMDAVTLQNALLLQQQSLQLFLQNILMRNQYGFSSFPTTNNIFYQQNQSENSTATFDMKSIEVDIILFLSEINIFKYIL